MLRSIGMPELLVIGAVAVLLFGGRRVGELGKGIGDSIREFRKSYKDMDEAAREVKKL